MDPDFSVLLGDTTSKKLCQSQHTKNNIDYIIEIVVPVVVGVFVLSIILGLIFSRCTFHYEFCYYIRINLLHHRMKTRWQVWWNKTKIQEQEQSIEIDRIHEVSVNSSAGSYMLRL
jgi:hypothetical protein